MDGASDSELIFSLQIFKYNIYSSQSRGFLEYYVLGEGVELYDSTHTALS